MNPINEFILAMESCYREYDSSAFIAISKGALYKEGAPVLIDVNNDIYGRSIGAAMNDLSDVWVNTSELAPFIRNMEDSVRFSTIGQRPGLSNTDIKFNFEYLSDYNTNLTKLVGQMYQGATEGTLDSASMNVFIKLGSDELSDTVKRQIVRSSIATLYVTNAKAMIGNEPMVDWSKEYLKVHVIPFITSFNSLKATALQEAKMAMDAINDMLASSNIRNQKLSEICAKHPEYAAKLNQVNYKINRNVIDVASFVTYAVLLKLHAIINNAIQCNDALTKLKSSTPVLEQTLIMEGVYGSTIISDATGDVADQLMQGDASAYTELANNVAEFHKGMLINRGMAGLDEPDTTYTGMIEEREYRKDPYNGIMEVLSEISASLDKISAASDDYLLVTDELIEKAGLDNPIDVRYSSRVKMASDTSEYDKACEIAVNGNGNLDIYATILHEIQDFPKNMETIAKLISDVKEKMNILETRFSDPVSHPWKINNEFKNTAAVNELKVFMSSLKEQYGNLVNVIAGNMMSRLKKLSVDAERISVKMDEEDPEPIGMQEAVDNTDYCYEMDQLMLAYEKGVTDIMMEALQETYRITWNEKVRGIRPVYEITDATPGGATNSVNASGTNQSQAAQGAAKAKSNIGQKLSELKDAIAKEFQNIIQKFTQNMSNRYVKMDDGTTVVNSLWIKNNKEELLNHNYTNQSVQILPYTTKKPWESIMSDITTFNGYLGNLKSDQLGNTTPVDAVKKVLSSYSLNVSGDTAEAACNSISTPLTNYFKLGKGDHSNIANEIVTYADSNLKAVMTDIVNFTDMYYTSGMNNLTNSLSGLQSTLSSLSASYVPESAMIEAKLDQLVMMLEDGEKPASTSTGTTSTQQKSSTATVKVNTNVSGKTDQTKKDDNKEASTSESFDAIKRATLTYNGCVLNAVRDRINDFFRAMTPFVKGKHSVARNQAPDQQNEQQQGQVTDQNGQPIQNQ